jgi:hypothetical protein
MITCRAVRRAISPFVDGELNGTERLAIARHLDVCAECASLVQSTVEIGDALRASAEADRRLPSFAGMTANVISRTRAESAQSWRAYVAHACDGWHWAIVGSGALAATFISTVLVSAILAFGPAPEREDSLSALIANLGSPSGAMFLCGAPSGGNQDARLFQIDNGTPAASRMTTALAVNSVACRTSSEADIVEALATAMTGSSGRVVALDSMHPAERKYIETLLDEIALRRATPAQPAAGRTINVHDLRLVTGMAVVAKAL